MPLFQKAKSKRFFPHISIYEKIQNPLILAFKTNKCVQHNFLKFLFFFEFLVHYYEFTIFRPAQLEVHLCNGWCKEMHWLNNPAVEDCRKLYKVLTGKDSDPAIFQETPTIQKEIVQQQPQQ